MREPKSNFTIKNCPCGTEMKVWNHIKDRKKYCSQKCKYDFRTRPKGLNYKIVVKNKSWFNKGDTLGDKHYKWKGDNVGYDALHDWIRRKLGPARNQNCEFCNSNNNVQWANKSHEYKRNVLDWLSLCIKCHKNYDKSSRGITRKLFPELKGDYAIT